MTAESAPRRSGQPGSALRVPLSLRFSGAALLLGLVVLAVSPVAAQTTAQSTGPEGSGIQLDLDFEDLLRDEDRATDGDGAAPSQLSDPLEPIESVIGGAGDQRVVSASGAVLRGLDKVAGEALDIPLAVGETAGFGRLRITLDDCRHPEDDSAAEAYAHIQITDPQRAAPDFNGWMIASSPALSALDHARYDVWLLRCSSS